MLNPAICAMFMFQGFQQEVARLTALSEANPIALTFECDSIQTMICETLAGGEIDCAEWMLDVAGRICLACEPAYQASEEAGIWYYDIAEWLGAEVACRCVKGDFSVNQLVDLAVSLTESWDAMSDARKQDADDYVINRITGLGMLLCSRTEAPGVTHWDTDDMQVTLTQRVGFIYTLTVLPKSGAAPLLIENVIFNADLPVVHRLV